MNSQLELEHKAKHFAAMAQQFQKHQESGGTVFDFAFKQQPLQKEKEKLKKKAARGAASGGERGYSVP
jgi:hypothetical protein